MAFENWDEDERAARRELKDEFQRSLVEMLEHYSSGGMSKKQAQELRDLAALRKEIVEMIDNPDRTELVTRLRFWLASSE